MERAQTLRGELEEQTGGSWRAFEGCLSILQAAGALEPLAQQEGQGSEAAQQQQEQEQQQGQEQQEQQEQQQGQEGAAAEVQAEQQGVTQQQAAAPLQPPAAEQAGEQPVEQQPAGEEQQAAPPAALDAAAAAADSVASSTEGGGAGSGTRVGFSALGLVAREVNCANELWMAVVLTHAAVQQLPPPQLAAVLSAGGWRAGWLWGERWPALAVTARQPGEARSGPETVALATHRHSSPPVHSCCARVHLPARHVDQTNFYP